MSLVRVKKSPCLIFFSLSNITKTTTIITDKAKRAHGTSPDTPCSFYSSPTNHDRHQDGLAVSSGPAIDVSGDLSANMLRQTATADVLELSPWVNQVCFNFHLW